MIGWIVFFLIAAAYAGAFFWLRSRGGRVGGFEAMGPFIMWRTQFGKPAIERLSRPRRFWERAADVGVWATWIVGILMLALVVLNAVLTIYLAYTRPSVVADSAQPPQNYLGLPGLNPFIPLGYGLVALTVALVVHEGSHALMSYVGRIRVKASGLLFFIVPVGAFVEPDEMDMEKATPRERLRVFAAGPASNFVVALVAGLLLSLAISSSVGLVHDGKGVVVTEVTAGSPAQALGLLPGDVLIRVDGRDVASARDFTLAINDTRAQDRIELTWLREKREMSNATVLADKYEFFARDAPGANDESFRGKGYLGVQTIGLDFVHHLHRDFANPFRSLGAFFNYTQYPLLAFFNGFDIYSAQFEDVYEMRGPFAEVPIGVFFGVVYTLFWIVWIDLTLGVFNALPAGPLDGGQMLRTALRARLYKRHGVDPQRLEIQRVEPAGVEVKGTDPDTQARLDRVQEDLRKRTRTVGLFVLVLLLLPIFGPYLVGLFL
ncbi:MAG TPA: site-2 protease family protein [Candidatus Thermoplasmatota archaeon]|nr:site-2 protease family protein [Candidatus Thermoplasmatota archaeon]